MFTNDLLQPKLVTALVGPPAVGKSTFIVEMGCENNTLSADSIREELGCAVINPDGTGYIRQDRNKEVFVIFDERYEKALQTGDAIVIDNTNVQKWALEKLRNKAKEYGYEFKVVLFDISLETILERNTKRGYKNVPADVVKRMYNAMQELDLSSYEIVHIVREADQK